MYFVILLLLYPFIKTIVVSTKKASKLRAEIPDEWHCNYYYITIAFDFSARREPKWQKRKRKCRLGKVLVFVWSTCQPLTITITITNTSSYRRGGA